MSDYNEKLRDPRWQQKRLKVLERDGWKCKACGSKTIELHVHHINYVWGGDPWDASDDDLVSLCSECHNFEEWLKGYHYYNDIAKAARIPNLLLWLAANTLGYLKVTRPETFEEVRLLLRKHTFDGDVKDFNAFVKDPIGYRKERNG